MRRSQLGTCMSALVLLAIASAHAADKPSPEAANRVVDYYYSDAQEPILMAFKLCEGVHEEGPQKHDCTEEVSPDAVAAGEPITLWMKYLVPRDASAQVLTQLDRDGITRQTYSRELEGALRYRTWHRTTLERTGEWTIDVFHEGKGEVTRLHSSRIQVQ